jgi:RHS repeat-associated protein
VHIQVDPGEPTPPYIWFAPASRTFYGATQSVTVHWCDAEQIASGSTRIWLNGTAVTHTASLVNDGSCNVHRAATVNLTFGLGINWVKARACETTTASCGTDSTTYVYSTTDATPPTAAITTPQGTYTQSTLSAGVKWCDDGTLNLGSHQVLWNGTAVFTSDAWQTGTDACWSAAGSSALLEMRPGANTLQASIRDAAGNLSNVATATFTYAPRVALVTPSGVRRPDLCAVGCFDATLGYATPAYVSLDVPRGAMLVYSSAHAVPRGFVQLDLNESLATPPTRVSLRLIRTDGTPQMLMDGRDAVFYDGANGVSRISAWFDASAMPTGTYRYRADVTRFFPDGSTQTDTVGVRVVIVNESGSRFGAGWSLAGYPRVHLPAAGAAADGVTVSEGDGTAGFFAAPACGASGPCTYTSPPGDFTTLTRDYAGFYRTSAGGDSAVFDLSGRLTRVRDRFGNQTAYAYYAPGCDPNYCVPGQLGIILDPAGKWISFAYSAATGLVERINLLGSNAVNLAYDAQRDLVRIVDPDGVTALTAAYSGHRLVVHADRAQNRSDVAYDRWGTIASVVGPAFRAQGSAAWRDTVRFRSQEAAVLPTGGQGSSTDPADRVDAAAVRALVVGTRADTTRLALDGWGAATEVRAPLGYTSRSARNADGLVTSTSDPLGNGVSYTWDGPRLTTAVQSPGSRTVRWEYNGPGGRVSREFGDVAETKYFYAGADRRYVLDSLHVAGRGMTRFTYDGRGRGLSQRDSAGHVVSTEYDPAGWQNTLRVTTDGGRATTYAGWDAWGRATQVTTPDLQTARVEFDALGRVIRQTAPDGGVVHYHYGSVFADSLTDARGGVWRWTRNQLGWVETEVRPGDVTGRHRTITYDRYGRVASITDRRGRTVGFGYDARDRLTTRTADGTTTYWSYSPDQPGVDGAPAWTVVSNPESTDSLHYDAEGRLARVVVLRNTSLGLRPYEIRYTYNLHGGLDSLLYQANGVWKRARYHQDLSTGNLSFLRDFGGRTTYLYYNGEGALRQMNLPNGEAATFTYTSNHQLTRIGYSGSLNAPAGQEFAYDAANRVASRGNAAGTRYRDYLYDSNGRLLQETDYERSLRDSRCYEDANYGWVCPDRSDYPVVGGRTYSYDLGGNPTDRGAAVQPGNRLTVYDGWTLQYDDEGNLTRKYKAGAQDVGYAWNDLGQLVQVTVNGAVAASYGYDGQGRRVRKTYPDGSTERYIYDGDDLLLQLDGAGSLMAEYTYWPGIDRVHGVIVGGAQYYYATDPQGSVLALSDVYGNVVNRYRYGSFGTAELTSETVANPLRWTGREWDAQAGLYYVRARWYDPVLQRFVSEDPLGVEGGQNLFGYAGNDPVNRSDPTGLIYCWTGIGLGPYGETEWFFHESCQNIYSTYTGWLRMRQMEERARQCDFWRCGEGLFSLGNRELVPPNRRERDMIEAEWGRIREDVPFCAQAKASARTMMNRQLLVWRTPYYERMEDGKEHLIVGENVWDYQRGGPVMYIYTGPRRRVDGSIAHTVAHEGIHGLTYPLRPGNLNPYYRHADIVPELNMVMDSAAGFCASRRPLPR